MKTKKIRIYNGVNFCPDSCGCGSPNCPVVDFLPTENSVEISDPAKPENGKFKMTVEEYNILLQNAKKIQN